MQIEDLYNLFVRCGVVTTDSRNTPQGSLFIALKGENFNGNRFAQQAVEAGCRYALVDEAEYANEETIFYVPDTLQTLQALARHHRRTLATPVVAITGTNGKTTTKELLAASLSKKFNLLYTQGNLNNHIGVPLTLLQLTAEHNMAVIEMGANHPGEIKTLVEIAEPNYGMITNVGKAHLEGFGSLEGVIRTKGEMYDYLRAHGGHIFRHAENPYLAPLAEEMSQTTYGEEAGLFVSGKSVEGSTTLQFDFTHQGVTRHVASKLIGNYNLPNALAAAAIALYLEVEGDAVQEALQEYTPQNNRSQLAQGIHNTLIIDAYNANPTSMMAALTNFAQLSASPKGVILGDMRELGSDSQAEHRAVVAWLNAAQLDSVVLVGAEFTRVATPNLRCYPTVDALAEALQQEPITHQTLLIKGSRGIHLERLIPLL